MVGLKHTAALVALLLAACATPVAPDLSDAPDAPADFDAERVAALAADGWTVCRPDPSRSLLEVRVFRAGRLARLGHNHVITTRTIGGWFGTHDGQVGADLYVAAGDLEVDNPTRRAEAGEAFTSRPTTDDRAGTRANMLGATVLAAEQHPFLRLRVPDTHYSRNGPSVEAVVTVAGATHEQLIEASLFDAGTLEGSFELTHGDLGLSPFTALGGALSVAETIEVRFTLGLTGDPRCASLAPPALTR